MVTSQHTAKRPKYLHFLKKTQKTLNKEFLKIRPVSNLHFVSKALEKVVALQLQNHLDGNTNKTILQSAYKNGHSLEKRF